MRNLLTVLAMAITFLLFGCSSLESQLAGTWECKTPYDEIVRVKFYPDNKEYQFKVIRPERRNSGPFDRGPYKIMNRSQNLIKINGQEVKVENGQFELHPAFIVGSLLKSNQPTCTFKKQ